MWAYDASERACIAKTIGLIMTKVEPWSRWIAREWLLQLVFPDPVVARPRRLPATARHGNPCFVRAWRR